MLTFFYELSPPVQTLIIGGIACLLYGLLFLLLHPLWIRQRIRKCNWACYKRKMFAAKAGLLLILSFTACMAVYQESGSWLKTALIAGMIICCIGIHNLPRK